MDMTVSLSFLFIFFFAMAVSVMLVPVAKFVSFRLNIVSKPGGRRMEERPMPKLGGLAIYGSFTLTIIVAQFLPIPRQDIYELVRLTGLILGGSFLFFGGIWDDLKDLGYFSQFLIQLTAAAIAIMFQIFIQGFSNPLSGQITDPWPHFVTVTLSIFWLSLMMNTVNFLDGLDGLAAGVAFIAGAMLFINSAFTVEPAQISVSLLPLALMGACAGFLLFNFYPARIYMGGSAIFLGYTLGVLSIIGGAKMATILLVMGLPLMDLAWQAVARLLRGRNPFSGDRGHIHFRLLDLKHLSHRQIVIFYYMFCAFFGGLTLILESQLYKFLAFTVMLLLIALGFFLLSRMDTEDQSSSSS